MNTPFIISIILLLFTLLSVYFTNKIKTVSQGGEKFVSITGIRGYLAFSIFIYHSNLWRQYIYSNVWESPKMGSIVYFGQTRILLFFMITSFLFTHKMFDSKNTPIDWKKFFLARFLRIFPMYLVSILILIIIIGIESDFELHDKLTRVFKDSLRWINFTITGIPNINFVKDTWLINAGVAWTLPIEIIFYFFIPIFALFFNIKPSYKVILISLAGMIYVTTFNIPDFHIIGSLGIGILLGIIQNLGDKHTNLKKIAFFITCLISIIFVYNIFFEGKHTIALLISTVIFVLICYEKSFFGLLHLPLSRKFGQITYSFYLLHGIFLYITFNYFIGIDNLRNYTNLEYWTVIGLIIFPLILVSQFTYLYIEVPFIKLTSRIYKPKLK